MSFIQLPSFEFTEPAAGFPQFKPRFFIFLKQWNTKFKTWGEATTLIAPYYLTPCCLPFHALLRLEQCIGMLLRTKGCQSVKRYKLHSGLALAYRSESNISFDSAPIVKMHTYCFYFRQSTLQGQQLEGLWGTFFQHPLTGPREKGNCSMPLILICSAKIQVEALVEYVMLLDGWRKTLAKYSLCNII